MMARTLTVSFRNLWLLGLLAVSLELVASSPQHGGSSTSSSSSSGIPRSQPIPQLDPQQRRYFNLPPWNPSVHIDEAGFLQGLYVRTPGEWEQEVRLRTVNKLDTPCRIRQVPGDGNCLFHSISLCLCHAVNGTQWNLSPSSSSLIAHGGASTTLEESLINQQQQPQPQAPPTLDDLYVHSQQLRADAVACLRDTRRRLFLQGRESLKCTELVEAAAQQYGMSATDYCESMREDSVWGGGPEIVALCNLLQRPIHVYELTTVDPATTDSAVLLSRATGCGTAGFVLRRMACFGSPRFDRQQALHILSADSRFPDLNPGRQLPAGNHFLAVFPVKDGEDDGSNERQQRKRLRGGDGIGANDEEELVEDKDVEATITEKPLLKRAASKYIQWWRETFQSYL